MVFTDGMHVTTVGLGEGIAGVLATIIDWAYEDFEAGIVAGAVPEPGSIALGCLAAGAVGIGAWRKRKKSV